MNGINKKPDCPEEKLSELMSLLAEYEEYNYHYKLERTKNEHNKNSEAFANADNWVMFYSKEIIRIIQEIEALQLDLMGEEFRIDGDNYNAGSDMPDITRITHPDIKKILEGFMPAD